MAYSAPSIRVPIAQGCRRVLVDGCVPDPGNVVRLIVGPNQFAQPVPADTETVVFDLGSPLSVTELSVNQGDGTMRSSNSSVELQVPPDPLRPPVFSTPLFTKSRGARLTHLVPGSVVKVFYQNAEIGRADVETDHAIVRFTGAPNGFGVGDFLSARVERAGQQPSPTTRSRALEDPPVVAERTTRPPKIGPVLECATTIRVSDSFAGATVNLRRVTTNPPFVSDSPFLFGADDVLLSVARIKPGETIAASQQFDIPEWQQSTDASEPAQALAPAPPKVTGALCTARETDIIVEGDGGARVFLRATGKTDNLLVGIIAAATGKCTLRVPANLIPNSATTMDVVLDLCGRTSAPTPVVLQPTSETWLEPKIATELFQCGRIIRVTDLTPNTYVEVLSSRVGVIGRKHVTNRDDTIVVSPALEAGDWIVLAGITCAHGKWGATVENGRRVKTRPNIAPEWDEAPPYYVGRSAVTVKGITPGSRVDVSVAGRLVMSEDIATDAHTFNIPALKKGDEIKVQQYDCSGPEERVLLSGPAIQPTPVKVTAATTGAHAAFDVTVGVPTLVNVAVTDAGNGALVNATINAGPDCTPRIFQANQPTLITVAASSLTSVQTVGTISLAVTPAQGYTVPRPQPLTVKGALKLMLEQSPPPSLPDILGTTVAFDSARLIVILDGVTTDVTSLKPTPLPVHRRTGSLPTTASVSGTVSYRLGNGSIRTAGFSGGQDSVQVRDSTVTIRVVIENYTSPPGSLSLTTGIANPPP